jgi:hypothetical protein
MDSQPTDKAERVGEVFVRAGQDKTLTQKKRNSYERIVVKANTPTGWICWIRSLSDVAETWWDAGGIFACPYTGSFSARCQNREGHSPLAIHTAAFVHVLVVLAAGFALCFGESINLT